MNKMVIRMVSPSATQAEKTKDRRKLDSPIPRIHANIRTYNPFPSFLHPKLLKHTFRKGLNFTYEVTSCVCPLTKLRFIQHQQHSVQSRWFSTLTLEGSLNENIRPARKSLSVCMQLAGRSITTTSSSISAPAAAEESVGSVGGQAIRSIIATHAHRLSTTMTSGRREATVLPLPPQFVVVVCFSDRTTSGSMQADY